MLAIATIAAACSSGSDDIPSAEQPTSTEAATAAGDDQAFSDEPAPVSDGDGPTCEYVGLSSLDWMLVEVSMTNDSGSLFDGRINWSLHDGDSLLVEGREIVTRLEPGESLRYFRNSQTEVPPSPGEIRCQVDGLEDSFQTAPDYDESAGGGCETVDLNNVGTVNVAVTVINQLDISTGLAVDVAVYDPNGLRLGSNRTFVTEVQNPGDATELTMSSRAPIPDGMSLDDLTCSIIGIEEW